MIIAQRETDLEVGEVGLLVELSRLKTEGVDDVKNLLALVVGTFLSLLGRSVGASVCGTQC